MHLGHDVVVVRLDLHRARFALHVHQDEAGAGLPRRPPTCRLAAAADVVHDRGAGRHRGPATRPWRVSMLSASVRARCAQPFDDRQDTSSSSSTATGSAPGRVDSPPTSTMSAPSSADSSAVRDRGLGVEVQPAVAE